MTNLKPWYLSRVIRALIVTTVIGVADIVGLPVGSLDNGALTYTMLQIVTEISGLIAFSTILEICAFALIFKSSSHSIDRPTKVASTTFC